MADSFNIRSNMLYRWKQQREQQSSKERLSEDERVELAKRSQTSAHEERVLKKASVDSFPGNQLPIRLHCFVP